MRLFPRIKRHKPKYKKNETFSCVMNVLASFTLFYFRIVEVISLENR
jgi:hypothetical protein